MQIFSVYYNYINSYRNTCTCGSYSYNYSYVLFQMAAFIITTCMLILHDNQSKITSKNSIAIGVHFIYVSLQSTCACIKIYNACLPIAN